jgi:hypothetical protein
MPLELARRVYGLAFEHTANVAVRHQTRIEDLSDCRNVLRRGGWRVAKNRCRVSLKHLPIGSGTLP